MIRRANVSDIDAVAEIYEEIHASGIDIGWERGVYPVRSTAQGAYDRGELFVYDEGGVKAAAIINKTQVPEYALGSWEREADDDSIMVMHTLVVSPAAASHGIGSSMVRFYEDYARENGCTELRMDTNAKNTRARAMYARLGYRETGIVPCVFNGIDGVSLVLLEKPLD